MANSFGMFLIWIVWHTAVNTLENMCINKLYNMKVSKRTCWHNYSLAKYNIIGLTSGQINTSENSTHSQNSNIPLMRPACRANIVICSCEHNLDRAQHHDRWGRQIDD